MDDLARTPPRESVEPSSLAPLLGARRFVKMSDDERRHSLEYAFQERLRLNIHETVVNAAAAIVENHRGQKDQLYDMVSEIGAQAVCDMSNVSDKNMSINAVPNATDVDRH